jgi:acetoin utilization deacetylase AcuC-like enzyme
MSTALITHTCFTQHDTGPGHPERPDRMRAIDRALERPEFTFLIRDQAPLRDDAIEHIQLAHPKHYVDELMRLKPQSGEVRLDPDTVMSPGTWEAVMRGVGAGLHAVDLVMDEKSGIKNAFCQVRPPGHHAETETAMGFCLFNNIAIAGLYARAKYGAERIAVVDFDVHHGNGTQDIFQHDKDLFFASTHQMPLYPGTGAMAERGVGNLWNCPLKPYDGGDKFKEAFESRILPALHDFAPDILFVSAGFDAHEDDPLANLRLREPDFAWATEKIAGVAAVHCRGRLVSMLEGGYDLNALARSVAAHVSTLMGA